MTEKTTTIHQDIALAIGEVIQLGKSERNNFDGYNFVSIDKFLALVNPICSKHGLFPQASQTDVEMYENTNKSGGKSTWARFYFDIILYHSSGESLPPSKIMVAVPMNGAQASGSAQSYALKQFFRGMFMIPTGDKDDADFAATEQHHTPNLASEGMANARTDAVLDSLPQDASPRDKAVAFSEAIIADITKAKTSKGVNNAWSKWSKHIDALQGKHEDLYANVFDAWQTAGGGE